MRVFLRSLPIRSPLPLIAVRRNRCWNGLECRDRNPGSHSLSARDARASARATIPDRRPRAARAIASYYVGSLTMGQCAQSAPAVPDDRACRTRCSVGREKFARDFVSAISRTRQTPPYGHCGSHQNGAGACHWPAVIDRRYSCHSERSRRPTIGHESVLETGRRTLIMRVKKLKGLKALQRYKKQLF